MKLIVGAIIKNEADRYLTQFLDTIKQFADEIIIVDDGSTDDSKEICKKYTDNVFDSESLFVKDESILRKLLWDKCIEFVDDKFNTWISILDADELITEKSLQYIREIIEDANLTEADSIGYHFYDMWDINHFRDDVYWCAHRSPTVHIIKYNLYKNYVWNNKKLHCGRFPKNAFCNIYASNIKVKHMGYITLESRKKKYESYMKLDGNGRYGIMEQYNSILDENVNLVEFVE